MAGKVYFGTSDKQMWVKAPATGMNASVVGYSTSQQFLNGGSSVRRSSASHRQFDMSWTGSLNSTDPEQNLFTIKDFSDGLYGSGPYYFVDPYAMSSNVMPPHWAAPMLAEGDWSKLSNTVAPTFTTDVVANEFPIKYATYGITGAYESTEKLTVIIPTGYTLNFGWHGPAAGSSTGIRIVPYLRSTGAADTAINPTKITSGGTTRTNTTVSGTTYSKVEIFLAVDATATVNITAMIAQILPTGSSVATGGFISGRGSTQLEFTEAPQITYVSAAINDGYAEMTAKLTEVV